MRVAEDRKGSFIITSIISEFSVFVSHIRDRLIIVNFLFFHFEGHSICWFVITLSWVTGKLRGKVSPTIKPLGCKVNQPRLIVIGGNEKTC